MTRRAYVRGGRMPDKTYARRLILPTSRARPTREDWVAPKPHRIGDTGRLCINPSFRVSNDDDGNPNHHIPNTASNLFKALQKDDNSTGSSTMDEADFSHTANTPAELVALMQQYHITTATHSQNTYEEMLHLASHVYEHDSGKMEML